MPQLAVKFFLPYLNFFDRFREKQKEWRPDWLDTLVAMLIESTRKMAWHPIQRFDLLVHWIWRRLLQAKANNPKRMNQMELNKVEIPQVLPFHWSPIWKIQFLLLPSHKVNKIQVKEQVQIEILECKRPKVEWMKKLGPITDNKGNTEELEPVQNILYLWKVLFEFQTKRQFFGSKFLLRFLLNFKRHPFVT